MPGRDALEKIQVVLDDVRVDGLARDVDEPRVRVPEPDQREQQPLLVVHGADDLAQFVLVDAERRHDDGRVCIRRVARHRRPDVPQPVFQCIESFNRVVQSRASDFLRRCTSMP